MPCPHVAVLEPWLGFRGWEELEHQGGVVRKAVYLIPHLSEVEMARPQLINEGTVNFAYYRLI